MTEPGNAPLLARWEVAEVGGAVVVVDVIRAFTTAAYAFAAGAREIDLTDTARAAPVAVTGEGRFRRLHDLAGSNYRSSQGTGVVVPASQSRRSIA